MLLNDAGTWWLPDAPQHPVPGILTMEGNDEPALRLIGGFDRRVFHRAENGGLMSFGEVRPIDCLHGQSLGRSISLLGCSIKSTKSGLLGPPLEQIILPAVVVVGATIDSAESKTIEAVEVCIENLTQWSGNSVFAGRIELSPEEGPTGRQTLEVEPVDKFECLVGSVRFGLKHRHSALRFTDEKARRTALVKEYAVLRIEFGAPVDLATCERYVADVQDLITLCVDSPCAILNEIVYVRTPSSDAEESPKLRRGDVFRRYIVSPDPEANAVESHEMLANLDMLPFSDVIPRWFGLIEQVRSSVRMITGLSYIRSGYLETRLVTAVSAAEGLHRSLYAGEAMSSEDFDRLRRIALDGLDADQAQWVRERLRNEPTLNYRLLDMASRVEKVLGATALPDVPSWAANAKRARNALVHRDEAGRPARQLQRMGPHKLDAIVESTLLVVTLFLFVELELAEEAFRSLPGKNRRLAQRATWHRNT